MNTWASKPGVWAIAALAFVLCAGFPAWAQDEEPSELAASDAQDLMGKWNLEMDFQGTPIQMNAEFKEEDGKTVAVVTSAMVPGELVISDITRDGDSLVLKGSVEMGEGDQATSINLTINMEVDGEKTTGHVKDDAGLIDAAVTGAKAVDMPTSDLDVADVEDWIGDWKLKMDFQGREVEMDLGVMDVGGKVAAKLVSQRNPEGTVITDITKTDDGLDLGYEMERQGQAFELILSLVKGDDGVTGTLGDTGGMFSAELTAAKAEGGATASGPASSLDVAGLEDAIGTWDVSMEFQGNPVGLTVTLKDVGGKVGATIVAPTSPEPIDVTDITKTDDGLELKYGVEFSGQPVDLIMALKLDGEALSGTLSDTNGMFSADLEGSKSAGDEAAGEPFKVAAEDASKLDVSDAKDYIGGWKLNMELRGNPMAMTLVLQDVEGKVGAYITSMFAPEPSVIEEIEMTDDGMKMLYEAQFGPQRLDINIVAKLESGALAGSFADAGGLISADFTGERLSESEVAATTRQAQRRGRRRGRGDTGNTRIKIDGKEITIAYATLKTSGPDYEALAEVQDGQVFTFTRGRATKLMTEADLNFDGVVLKQGNAHETYPGVYSLWVKKTADGWNLVANEHADIWGTQHKPDADVAEIPLTVETVDSEQEVLEIELIEEGQGGTLKVAWGDAVLSAKFTTQ